MLEINVQQIYFDAIASGAKTIEGRLAKEKFRKLRPGDSIRFSNNEGTQFIIKTVAATYFYPTFEIAFQTQNFRHAIPNAATVADAVKIYEQFYTKQMQQVYDVIFIELK